MHWVASFYSPDVERYAPRAPHKALKSADCVDPSVSHHVGNVILVVLGSKKETFGGILRARGLG